MMQGKTILVADDEPTIRYMLDMKLRQVGFEVIVAKNGEEAYKLACEHQPDLVVSDYQMPVLDGLELCKQLAGNSITAQIPVIMLTARSHKASPEELRTTNIKCLLDKPFSPRQLIAKINELLLVSPESTLPVNDAESSAA